MICENCGKEHDGNYGSGRFCSKECAKSFSTKKDNYKELKEAKCIDCKKIIYINKRSSIKTCRCKNCKNKYLSKLYPNKYKNGIKISKLNCNLFDNIDCEKCYFKIHNICKSKASIKYKLKTLEKYCDLHISNYENTLQEYLEIKYNIQQMINNGLSGLDICKNLCQSSKKGNTLFEILQINGRNLSESVANAFIKGKLKAKCGYHNTWNNKEVFLRSSYELDYAKELDENQIDYEVEKLHIKYWDTQLLKYREAVPDFYLPQTNTIVEIKSSWTYDEQNMIDRKKAYEKNNYHFILILDHKEKII